MQDSSAIEIHHISKSFDGKEVVKKISLRVKTGEIFGFLGPNGSGKTTTIRMICGLLTPDNGEGQCLGYNIITEAYQIKRLTGYMPQKFSLYEDLSIYENLDFIARLYNMDNRLGRVQKSLEHLGLTDRSKQLAGNLSGGWKQRLALAAALLHEPKLLLLDEPTAGVDPKARREFWDQIHQLADKGITVLVSTHYMDEAERCHQLAYIFNGVLLVSGTASEIISKSNLVTWEILGKNLKLLSEKLHAHTNEWQVSAFGNTLHLSYHKKTNLEKDISLFQSSDWTWKKINVSLEDVFVNLEVFNA